LLLIVTMVIFLAFESASMGQRLTVIRETRPHIADGLINFGQRVRKYWIVTTVFGFIVAVLDVIGLIIIACRCTSPGASSRSSPTTSPTSASSSA
jgi:AI-2 transport protein TqsA